MNRRAFLTGGRMYYLAMALLLLGYLAWGAMHLGGFQWDDDEGVNVIKAQLVGAGYRLYHDIWSDQPPLLTWMLALAFRLAGRQVAVGRLLILLFAVGGLLGVALMARRTSSPPSTLFAAALLALAPEYFTYSRAIMVGLPSKVLALFALATLRCRRGRWALTAAGALFGASLLTKPITAYQALVLAALAALPSSEGEGITRRGVLRRWGWMALGGGSVLLPVTIMTGPQLIAQVVGTYAATKTAYPFSLAANLSWLGDYLVRSAGLCALAAWGIAAWVRSRRLDIGVGVLWLALTVIALLTHTPLRGHQFLLLLFPLALLAAVGGDELKRVFLSGTSFHRALVLITAFILLGWVGAALRADAGLLIATDDDNDHWAAVDILRQAVAPDEVVVTDAPMLAFRADRLTPPELAVPSLRRLRTGGLTEEFAIERTASAHPRAVILWDGRFDLLPDYVEWVEQHYELARSFGHGRRRIYLSIRDVPYPQEVNFGGEIKLLGYRLDRPYVEPGGTLHVTLYWQAVRRPTAIYAGFVHLLGPEGGLLSQRDLVAGTWSHVTAAWRPGEIVAERYELEVPRDAPPGPWPLEVGLYGYHSHERLPVLDAQAAPTEVTSVLLSLRPVVRWRMRVEPPPCAFGADTQFGQIARLVGYDLEPASAAPGEEVRLTLCWQALGTASRGYTVFVHVLGPDGRMLAQADAPPCEGRCPTYGWVPEEYLTDRHAFTLPADAPDGGYQIAVGLYDLTDGERLPARDGGGRPLANDCARLRGLEVSR